MLIIHNPVHHLHHGRQEMYRGRLVECHEVPDRLEQVLAELRRRSLGELQLPEDSGLDDALAAIHTPAYLGFLAGAWNEWVAIDPANAALDALPSVWPTRGMRTDVLPDNFAARLGLYAFDAGTPLTAGSWTAARAGAACALSAARAVASGGAHSALALSRPPGHHAGAGFLRRLLLPEQQRVGRTGAARCRSRAGGGARHRLPPRQRHAGDLLRRADVLTVSIHGDPRTEYPFFLGHADETGVGEGAGCNLNLPLPRGTGFRPLARGAACRRWRPSAASAPPPWSSPLGVDTFEGDPISGFRLQSTDYLEIGHDIAKACSGLPLVWVFEGGYAVAELGVNLANLLEGAAAAH